MAKFVYIRVSSLDQNPNRQIDAATALGIPQERIFLDRLSGKDTKRPELQRLMSIVQRGDTVIVESISRFARNTRDLLDLVEQLTEKGVEFVSQKENLDTATPTGKFMLTIFGAVSELERGYILQRQAEGIASAKRRGKHLGRPAKKPPKDFKNLVKLWEYKEISLQKVLDECGGVCAATFYNWLRESRATAGSKR
ncbi:resolvase [Clostridia bacterium]|nr:resolvase [Clostridia bacterium]